MNKQKKTRYFLIICRLILFCGIIFPLYTFAVSNKTTYQAKIIKPDGNPLEATSVNFKFTILDPSASCILYVEEYSAVNMNGTGGLIFFSLGSGNRTYPASGGSTLASVFDNSVVSFPCQSPGLYPPTSADNRKIVMQFNDGTGWQTLPAMAINSVPFSMYAGKADDSTQLNGKSDTAFVEKSTLAALNCNSTTHAITFNGVSFSCIAVGGGGGITSVTTSGTVLSAGGSASAPVISITAVSMSSDGYLTSLDYAEFKAKLSASPTQIINTLGYSPVSGAAVATQINNSNLSGDVSGAISSNSVIGVGGKTASQISTSVEDTLAATASSTADTIVKRNSSGNATFNDIYANSAKLNYVDIYKPSANFNIRLQAPTSLSTNYVLNLPTTSGAVGQVLSTDGAGNLSWVNPSTGSVTSVSGTASEITSTGGVTPTLGLANIGTVGTYYKVITDNKGRVTSGATTLLLSDLPNTVLNTTSAFAGDVSGIISNITVNRIQGVSVTVTSLAANDIFQYDGSKYVNRNIPICVGNQYLTFNGTSFSCVFDAGASGTVASISVTGPISSTGGSSPTLSIAQATSGIDGYLSSTDWNTFNNKLSLVSATASFLQKTGDTMAGLLALQAGTTANAPLKFTSGTLLSSAQSGTIEYDGSQLYFTDGASIRRAIATNSSQGSFDNTSSISNTSGNITLSPNNITGSVIVNSSQASISSGTGALVVNGGLGVAGNINAGGNLNLSGSANIGQSLQLPSMTNGSLLFAGASGLVSEDNSRLFWDGANKRLGLGTNSPAQTLSVSGAGYFTGNVGVGTASPGDLLHIGGGVSNNYGTGILISGPSSDNNWGGGIQLKSSDLGSVNSRIYASSGGLFLVNNKPTSVMLSTSGTERMRIDSSGNVGIGTTTPTSKLHLYGGNVNFQLDDGNGIANFQKTSTDLRIATQTALPIWFATNGTERVRVDSAGNVGIGTTTPAVALDVAGVGGAISLSGSGVASPSTGLVYGIFPQFDRGLGLYSAAAGTGQGIGVWTNKNGTTPTEVMTILRDGNVGIGTTSPTQQLSVGPFTYVGANGGRIRLGPYHDFGGLYIGPGSATSDMAISLNTYGRAANNDYSTLDNTSYGAWSMVFGHQALNGKGFTIRHATATAGTPSFTDHFTIQDTGNVGIGTTAPDSKFQVMGTSDISAGGRSLANFTDDTALASGVGGGITLSGKYTAAGVTTTFAQIWSQKENATDGNFAGSLLMGARRNGGSVGSDLMITSSGNVGIGTVTPNEKLDLSTGATYNTVNSSGVKLGNSNADSVDNGKSSYYVIKPGGNATGVRLDFIHNTRLSGTTFTGETSVMSLVNGNVGIGVTNPSAKLELASGIASLAPLKFTSGTLLSSAQSGSFEYDGFNFYVTDSTNTRRAIAANTNPGTYDNVSNINSSSNITLTPTGSVVVSSTTASTNSSTGALVVKGGLGVAGNIYASGTIVTSSNIQGASVTATSGMISPYIAGSVASGGSLTLDSTTHSTKGNILLAPNGGNVGIGTNSPVAKLHVTDSIALGSGGTFDLSVFPANNPGAHNSGTVPTTMSFGGSARVTYNAVRNLANTFNDEFLTFSTHKGGISQGERMRIDPIGNVGIGTSLPSSRLESRVDSGSIFTAGTSSTDVLNVVSNKDVFINSNQLVVRGAAGGNVGIGTSSPASALHVVGAGRFDGATAAVNLKSTGTTGDLGVLYFSSSSTDGLGQVRYDSGHAMRFLTNSSERVRIDSSGNVGIGTSAPTYKLDVSGGGVKLDGRSALTDNAYFVGSPTVGFRWNSSNDAFNNVIMYDNGNMYVRGNVGIGTTTPEAQLDISNSSMSALRLSSTAAGGKIWEFDSEANGVFSVVDRSNSVRRISAASGDYITFYKPDGSTSVMHLTGTGNVGIGTSTPSAKLDVTGEIKLGNTASTCNASNEGQQRYNSTVKLMEYCNGSAWYPVGGGPGQIISKTIQKNCTRWVVVPTTSIIFESFTVNKKYASSTLLIEGTISGFAGYSGSMQQQWKYGAGAEVAAQGIMYEPSAHGRIFSTAAVIEGHTTTGAQTMLFKYYSAAGTDKPFLVYNPSASDDTRLTQTCSIYVVSEVAQ